MAQVFPAGHPDQRAAAVRPLGGLQGIDGFHLAGTQSGYLKLLAKVVGKSSVRNQVSRVSDR